MSISRYILVQDPWHDYAVRFIEHIHNKYGYRALCFYSNRSEFIRNAPAYPLLQSNCIAAIFEVAPDSLEQFAAYLSQRYDIAAVIPFNEPTVASAMKLAEQLNLNWSQPQIIGRFRDKYLLKDYLRSRDTSLRLNATCQVRTAKEVALARTRAEFARFVLKPNDGFGNRSIGMFDANSEPAQIEHYLRDAQSTVLMEEFIDGTEYFVNGQIDAIGQISVVAIFEYQRVTANGRTNIDYSTRNLAHTDPVFARLETYSLQVMRASGLRRSPFHLELKVDANGPCLIEVAARLPGLGNAFLSGELQGKLDWFDIAAHYYLSESDYGPLALDWAAYDSAAVRYVHGIAAQSERIYQLRGIQAVEALPEFFGWVKQPRIGDNILPTRDCLSMPWNLIIKASSDAQASAVEAQIRELIAWNQQQNAIERYITIANNLGQRLVKKLQRRLRYMLTPFSKRVTILSDLTPSTISRNALQRFTTRCVSAVVRRYQLARFGKNQLPFPPKVQPEYISIAEDAVAWAGNVMAKPHPQLHRPGPICPFVRHTIDIGKYFVSVRPEIDGSSIHVLRRIVLDEAAAYLRNNPNVGSKGAFASLTIVFPHLADERLDILDALHSELKTAFMQRDLICTPFHKYSSKPSISNADFKVFRAPLASLVVRHLDVRDIAFLSTNRKAFLHFHSRYAHLFAQGKVSNEFGYVRMFDEACVRFGLTSQVAAIH